MIEMDAWLDEELNIASSSGTIIQNGQRTEPWKHLVGFQVRRELRVTMIQLTQHVAPFLRSLDRYAVPVILIAVGLYILTDTPTDTV